MAMMGYATKQILEIDPDFKSKIQGLDEKIQWKIGDDIQYLTTIKDGTVDGAFGTDSNPTLVFEISDAKTAIKALAATEENISDFEDNVKVSDVKKAEELAFMTITIAGYLKNMTGGEGD